MEKPRKYRNRLTLVRERVEKRGHNWYNEYLCECGNKMMAPGWQVDNGNTNSCGCLHKEWCSKTFKKHGNSKTRLYRCWASMKDRCDRKKCVGYEDYGGRGISYCLEWKEFDAFQEWALNNGYSNNLTIERKEVNGNYCPENCCWIPKSNQGANTRRSIRVPEEIKAKLIKEYKIGKISSLSRKYNISRHYISKLYHENSKQSNSFRQKEFV